MQKSQDTQAPTYTSPSVINICGCSYCDRLVVSLALVVVQRVDENIFLCCVNKTYSTCLVGQLGLGHSDYPM